MSKLASQLLPPAVLEALPAGPDLWLVGGALRDHFMQRPQPDRDFAIDGDACGTARSVADRLSGHYYTLDRERDAGRVLLDDGRTLDFVRLRGASIQADLELRDFTINALATPVHGEPELIDPLGGLQDLRDKRLLTCSPSSIHDDPIRALRGARIAHELQLRIPTETADFIRQAAPGLAAASVERARDELARMLAPSAVGALRLANELDGLAAVLPEAAGEPAMARSGLAVAGRLAELLSAVDQRLPNDNFAAAQIGISLGRYREPVQAHLNRRLTGGRRASQMLFLAALHQPLEHAASAIFHRARALHFSRQETQHARTIVRNASPSTVFALGTAIARFRFFEAAGEAGVEAVLLALAAVLAGRAGPPDHAEWERQTLAAGELLAVGLGQTAAPPPVLDGDQLMRALGLQPGPQVGRLLAQIREAQIGGQVDGPEAAIELARSLLED